MAKRMQALGRSVVDVMAEQVPLTSETYNPYIPAHAAEFRRRREITVGVRRPHGSVSEVVRRLNRRRWVVSDQTVRNILNGNERSQQALAVLDCYEQVLHEHGVDVAALYALAEEEGA